MWDEIAKKYQKYVETQAFNGDQLTQIMEGLKDNVEIITFADPKFDADQMREVRLGLANNVDIKIYCDIKYDALQMKEIRRSLEEKLDPIEIKSIANPEFNAKQMAAIRECYRERLSLTDIKMILNPKFNSDQMNVLLNICKKGATNPVVLKRIANPLYTAEHMEKFSEFLKYDIDLTIYCDPSYSVRDLEFFFNCLDNYGIAEEDLKALLSKALSYERRCVILEAYAVLPDKFAIIGANPEYSDDQVDDIYFMLKEKYKILYQYKNIWTNDNEAKLVNLLKYNSRGGGSKLWQLNNSQKLELTWYDEVKWNITKLKAMKTKMLKVFKELEKIYSNKK